MKEFSNIISVYPLSELSLDNPEPWTSEIIGAHNFNADDFTIEPNEAESEAGNLLTFDKTFYIDKPSSIEAAFFSYPVKSILVIKDSDGNKYPIGSRNIPATVAIQNNLQKSSLVLKASLLTSPF